MVDVLHPDFLLHAYASGFFHMPHPETGQIEWFRPDPRAIFPLNGFHCSRSLKKAIRTSGFDVTVDSHFAAVMDACADRAEGTWITAEFMRAYGKLHALGHAHSVEISLDRKLVGGVYGVSIRGAFFAESMFHRERNASKAALYHLVERLKARGFQLLEAQFLTPHLASLGAIEISDDDYQTRLKAALRIDTTF